MMVEQLKIMALEEFKSGSLVLKGSEFCVQYMNKEENRSKLIKLLVAYSKVNEWVIKMQGGEVSHDAKADDPATTRHQIAQVSTTTVDKQREIVDHPQIKSLQRVFPGSKIEGVKLKENK